MGCWFSNFCDSNDKVEKISKREDQDSSSTAENPEEDLQTENVIQQDFASDDIFVLPNFQVSGEDQLSSTLIAARLQLDASEYLGGGHARKKHAGLTEKELQSYGTFTTAYLTKEDQDKALASAIRELRKQISLGDTVRNIQVADVKTDRFPILISSRSGVRKGFSSRMKIIRRPGIRDSNIITAYPLPE